MNINAIKKFLKMSKKISALKVRVNKMLTKTIIKNSQKILNDSRNIEAYLARARANRMLRNYDLSIADFTKALELRPGDSQIITDIEWVLSLQSNIRNNN